MNDTRLVGKEKYKNCLDDFDVLNNATYPMSSKNIKYSIDTVFKRSIPSISILWFPITLAFVLRTSTFVIRCLPCYFV